MRFFLYLQLKNTEIYPLKTKKIPKKNTDLKIKAYFCEKNDH